MLGVLLEQISLSVSLKGRSHSPARETSIPLGRRPSSLSTETHCMAIQTALPPTVHTEIRYEYHLIYRPIPSEEKGENEEVISTM